MNLFLVCNYLHVVNINEEHFDQLSSLQQEFVTFLDQYDKLETDIFTDGYNDELKIFDNISPHTREEYKLDNNVKYYGVYFFTYLQDLLMQIYDHRDLFSKMSSKMKQHIHDIFDMYEKFCHLNNQFFNSMYSLYHHFWWIIHIKWTFTFIVLFKP